MIHWQCSNDQRDFSSNQSVLRGGNQIFVTIQSPIDL